MPDYPPRPGFSFPGPPPKEAVDFFQAKGLKPGFDYRDVWREEHAYSFTVAKAMQVDVLDSIRAEVDRALAEGMTFRQFQKGLTPTLQKLGWWGKKEMVDPVTGETKLAQLGSPRRLKTIFDANMRTARAAGQWQRMERTAALLPYAVYELGPSRRHRPQHASWHGTLLPLSDPWWRSHFPPLGYGCKCRCRQVGEREAGRMKRDGIPDPEAKQIINPETGLPTGRREKGTVPVKTTAPPIKRRAWVNKRTGEKMLVPDGIDPGWDTNPGLLRRENMDRMLAGKLEAAEPELARVAIRDLVASPRFEDFLDRPDGNFPVLRLVSDAARAIGAQSETAVLSAESASKNLANHPDLTLADYRQLPLIGESPSVIVRDGGQTVVLVRDGESTYWAVVKATATGEGTFVTSFRKAREKAIRTLLAKGEVIYGQW